MVLRVSTIARRRLNGKAAADRGRDAIMIGEYERAFYGKWLASPEQHEADVPCDRLGLMRGYSSSAFAAANPGRARAACR
jgi:hypothetical protein